MIVEITHTQERLGLKKGDRYVAKVYPLDPSKVTLANKITKEGRQLKKMGNCNQYKSEVKLIN